MGAVLHEFPGAAKARMVAALLNRHSAQEIADAVEILIDVLDLVGADTDLEDGDEDRCAAGDDDLTDIVDAWFYGPGDPDDSEDDSEDRCPAGDDGCGPVIHDGQVWFGSVDDESDIEAWHQPVTLNPAHQEQGNHG